MDIAFLLFEGMTALDAVGPYEILQRVPGSNVRFVAKERGEQRAEDNSLGLVADYSFKDDVPAEVLLVPGGLATRQLVNDEETLEWIRQMDQKSEWTTAVCTGSLLLAATGLLKGREATTHWLEMEMLGELGAKPVEERVVHDGKFVTGAGVTAGIDMAITLVALMHDDFVAQALQLAVEYDPQPPFASGSPRTARRELVDLVREMAASRSLHSATRL
jgi:putative intracellular protease/amidase